MATKGQAAVGAVGTGAMASFLTWLGYKKGLITLPSSIANLFGVPRKVTSPVDKQASETAGALTNQSDCESHGFTWWTEKGVCVISSQPDIGSMTLNVKIQNPDQVAILELDKPYYVTMLTYIFKVGGGWNPQKGVLIPLPHMSVWYKDLDGKYQSLGQSGNGKMGEWSTDNSAVVNKKVTGFKWEVNHDWWYRYDIQAIKITGLM